MGRITQNIQVIWVTFFRLHGSMDPRLVIFSNIAVTNILFSALLESVDLICDPPSKNQPCLHLVVFQEILF